jgi:hypothetical protein
VASPVFSHHALVKFSDADGEELGQGLFEPNPGGTHGEPIVVVTIIIIISSSSSSSISSSIIIIIVSHTPQATVGIASSHVGEDGTSLRVCPTSLRP